MNNFKLTNWYSLRLFLFLFDIELQYTSGAKAHWTNTTLLEVTPLHPIPPHPLSPAETLSHHVPRTVWAARVAQATDRDGLSSQQIKHKSNTGNYGTMCGMCVEAVSVAQTWYKKHSTRQNNDQGKNRQLWKGKGRVWSWNTPDGSSNITPDARINLLRWTPKKYIEMKAPNVRKKNSTEVYEHRECWIQCAIKKKGKKCSHKTDWLCGLEPCNIGYCEIIHSQRDPSTSYSIW